jgi:hypothetical protein
MGSNLTRGMDGCLPFLCDGAVLSVGRGCALGPIIRLGSPTDNVYLSICLSNYLWLYSPFRAQAFYLVPQSFFTDGRTLWSSDQPVTRPLPKHRATQTQNKRPQTSTSQVGFEPTIPVFVRAKTFHALDRAATGIGYKIHSSK